MCKGALQHKESCLTRKLTSKFLWGNHVEGARDALQLSFLRQLLAVLCHQCMCAYATEEQWPSSVLSASRARKDTSGYLSQCTESPHCIKHIYLPDPTHCERRDHAELRATAAVCRVEKAHPSLFLWPKESRDGSQSYNNTLPSIYIRHCCDICLCLYRTNGEWDLKWKWSIKHCNFLHPYSFPGRMRNRVPVKYFGCKLFWCMLQWTA